MGKNLQIKNYDGIIEMLNKSSAEFTENYNADDDKHFENIACEIMSLYKLCGTDGVNQNFCRLMQNIMEHGGAESLINDDNGHWAISADGIQSVSVGRKAKDVNTTFFIDKKDWSDTIAGALVKWAKEVLK